MLVGCNWSTAQESNRRYILPSTEQWARTCWVVIRTICSSKLCTNTVRSWAFWGAASPLSFSLIVSDGWSMEDNKGYVITKQQQRFVNGKRMDECVSSEAEVGVNNVFSYDDYRGADRAQFESLPRNLFHDLSVHAVPHQPWKDDSTCGTHSVKVLK